MLTLNTPLDTLSPVTIFVDAADPTFLCQVMLNPVWVNDTCLLSIKMTGVSTNLLADQSGLYFVVALGSYDTKFGWFDVTYACICFPSVRSVIVISP